MMPPICYRLALDRPRVDLRGKSLSEVQPCPVYIIQIVRLTLRAKRWGSIIVGNALKVVRPVPTHAPTVNSDPNVLYGRCVEKARKDTVLNGRQKVSNNQRES